MTVGLESSPPEIIWSILRLLDLADVGNLRLTSRCLRSKATQGHFQSCLRSKRVKVTGPELESLATVTQRGWLGCEIHDLTLVGVVNNTKSLEEAVRANPDDPRKTDLEILQQREREYLQLLESGRVVHLLGKAFKSLAANSAIRKLRSLSLKVIVYVSNAKDEPPPISGGPLTLRPIWQMAAETYQIVVSALQDSSLEIDNMYIFSGQQRCSIAGNELSTIDYRAEGLTKTLHSLKSLSISVSEQILSLTLPDEAEDDSEYETTSEDEDRAFQEAFQDAMMKATDEANFTGLPNLIQACENLRSLELHYYRANWSGSLPRIPSERFFQRIAALDTLPAKLEECSLRGLILDEENLLAFLRRLPLLRRFAMETVTLHSGSFRSILDHCTSDTSSNLEYLYLDELLIQRDLVHFTGVGEPRFHNLIGAHGGNTLKREGADVKKPIPYHLPDNGMLQTCDSPAKREWIQDQRREYGPPR
ncbi:hypothetical protein BDV12DRAFT_179997 [Aspergillus spectabilis]